MGKAGAAEGGRYSDNSPPVRDIHIDHVTAFPTRGILTFINRTGAKIPGLSITNSILTAGLRQIGLAGPGPENCASVRRRAGAAEILDNCFSDFVVTHNIIIDGFGEWPAGNTLVRDANAVGLLDFRNGQGGNYRLCRAKHAPAGCQKTSPALKNGNDGRDIGADIDAIENATAGVI